MLPDLRYYEVTRQVLDAQELQREREVNAEAQADRALREKRQAEQQAQRERKGFGDALDAVKARDAAEQQRKAKERDERGRFASPAQKDWSQASKGELSAYLRSMGVHGV